MTLDEELALIDQNKAAPPAPDPATAPVIDPATLETTELTTLIGTPPPKLENVPASAPVDDMPPLQTGLPVLTDDEPTSVWDNVSAGWTEDTITRNRRNYHETKRRDLAMDMFSKLSEDARQRVMDRRWDYENNWTNLEQMVIDEVSRDIARDPARYGDMPLTIEDFDARITAEEKAELEEAQATLERPGGLISEFFGAAGSTMASPTQVALMFAGAGAGGLVRVIASEAAIGGMSEAVDLPDQFAAASRLDQPEPNALAQIGLGAALGGGLAGAIAGAARLPSAARSLQERALARRRIAIQSAPEGMAPHDAELAVDAAEGQLRGERTVQEAIAPQDQAGTLGDVLGLPDKVAPANWASIRNGIFAGESQGDYDALFGFSNRPGGQFQNVRITEMTVDQAIEFSSPSNTYAQTVKGQIGRVATPMGAYQVVGTTLRAAKKALGLTGREKMDKRTQDLIGQWIYRNQGTGAWVGYKGPRATPPPPPSADAPVFRTSRDYTGVGQVSTADGQFKIDVEYEVVDLSSLFRASGKYQPRDRTAASSDAQIADIAARLDPALLMPSPTADRGTPIVGPNGMIESGNGRYAAIERAYERHPDRAAAYRTGIEGAGFPIPEGISRPILVARRKTEFTDDQLISFTVAAQRTGVAVMTPAEVAQASGRAMTGSVLSRIDPTQPLTSEANAGFVNALMQAVPPEARGAMVDAGKLDPTKKGRLNANGARLLREALFARAWPAPDILARYVDGEAGELKGMIEALEKSAPAWAALRADIETGLAASDIDISDHVLDAMRLISQAREIAAVEKARRKKTGTKSAFSISDALEELLTNPELLEGPVPPLTVAMVRKFWAGNRPAKADDIAGFLTRYANDARKAGASGALFDAPGPRDVLLAIDKTGFGDLPEDIGAARGYRAAEITRPEALPEAGFDQGAASPEAIATDATIRADLDAPPPVVGQGPFGPQFIGYAGNPEAAIAKLMDAKAGEVAVAYVHPDPRLGDISIVYGNEAFGLKHIAKKHPEMIARLPDILRNGRIVEDVEGQPRMYLVTDGVPAEIAVIRLDWDGVQKHWLVTSYVDDWGKFARDQKEAYRTDPSDTRVPVSNGQDKSNIVAPPNQAPDAIDEALAKSVDTFSDLRDGFGEMSIDMPDGTSLTLRDVLDDLDEDAGFDAFLQACAISPTGATT